MRDIRYEAGRLPGRGLIAVGGPDAGPFLHNLVTADTAALAEGASCYSALLSPQGKILFDFFATRTGGGYLLDCSMAQRPELMKRLSFYKLRAAVTVSADARAVAVSPDEPGAAIRHADPRVPALGWRYVTDPDGSEAHGYDAARIGLGLADSDADLESGAYFPHEANLDQLGAVSFRKGCYIGQEVVSRMEHRGTARSRILPVTLDFPAPAKGSDIRAGGKQVGTLLSSAGEHALALIRLDRLAEAAGPLLSEGVRVAVHKPQWARYDMPMAGDAT